MAIKLIEGFARSATAPLRSNDGVDLNGDNFNVNDTVRFHAADIAQLGAIQDGDEVPVVVLYALEENYTIGQQDGIDDEDALQLRVWGTIGPRDDDGYFPMVVDEIQGTPRPAGRMDETLTRPGDNVVARLTMFSVGLRDKHIHLLRGDIPQNLRAMKVGLTIGGGKNVLAEVRAYQITATNRHQLGGKVLVAADAANGQIQLAEEIVNNAPNILAVERPLRRAAGRLDTAGQRKLASIRHGDLAAIVIWNSTGNNGNGRCVIAAPGIAELRAALGNPDPAIPDTDGADITAGQLANNPFPAAKLIKAGDLYFADGQRPGAATPAQIYAAWEGVNVAARGDISPVMFSRGLFGVAAGQNLRVVDPAGFFIGNQRISRVFPLDAAPVDAEQNHAAGFRAGDIADVAGVLWRCSSAPQGGNATWARVAPDWTQFQLLWSGSVVSGTHNLIGDNVFSDWSTITIADDNPAQAVIATSVPLSIFQTIGAGFAHDTGDDSGRISVRRVTDNSFSVNNFRAGQLRKIYGSGRIK